VISRIEFLAIVLALNMAAYGHTSRSNARAARNLIGKDAAANSDNSHGECFVDGNLYPRTSSGINAALVACSPGRTHLTGGTYNNLTSSINIACGQSLIFEGNPALSFSLPGSAPAVVYNSSQCGSYGNGVSGSAVINMQHTGGTVFKLCVGGHIGGVFGPSDGTINVSNQTGNTIDFGPCSRAYSVANFTVQNIVSQTVPGDLIHVITNNYFEPHSPSPYIEAITFSHIGAIDVTGRVIRIDANAPGPEANVNGLLFDHIFATNSTHVASPPAPIYIQSSFTSLNSISFQVRDSVIGFPFATGAITIIDSDGKPDTNGSILSVVLEGVDAQGGTLPAVPFSLTIAENAPATSDLQYRGSTNATSIRTIYSKAFASTARNSATTGVLRLAPTDRVCWGNLENNADTCLSKTASDSFLMPGPLFKANLVMPKIGGGSTINAAYRGSGIIPNSPFTSIPPQSCQEQTLPLAGAAGTGIAAVSPASNLGNVNLSWSAYVSSPDTVAVRVCNPSGETIMPSSTTWNVLVVQ
jgi:hypothetical protein